MDTLLERQIQDTTGFEDGDVCHYQCSCGTSFSDNDAENDVGDISAAAGEINAAGGIDAGAVGNGENDVGDMDVAADINAAGGIDARAVDNGHSDVGDIDAAAGGGNIGENACNVGAAACSIISAAENNETVTMEAIEVSMQLAAKDSTQLFAVKLNGQVETFKYMSDPINGTASRLMFARESWHFSALYWYDMFGAMQTAQLSIVTPAAFRAKDGKIYVCYGIGRTMCHRPRYDGLCVNTETKAVSFVQHIVKAIDQVVIDYSFDAVEIESLIHDFITRNRWVYNAERGLKRTCKEPMKPDTSLKKYMARPQARVEEDSEEDVQEKQEAKTKAPKKTKPVVPKPVVAAAVNKPIPAAKRSVADKWVPSKKTKKVVHIESSTSDSSDEEFMKKPPIKKARVQVYCSPPPKNVLSAIAVHDATPVESQITTVDVTKSTSSYENALHRKPECAVQNPEPPINCALASTFQTAGMSHGASIETIHMMSGLLFENMKQRSRLEEQRSRLEAMERNEAARREEKEKSEFQKQLTMLFCSSSSK